MKRTAVINVVGLCQSLIGDSTPRIKTFTQKGALATIQPAFPAVTCTAQSNYLTGTLPRDHGIVGNGWYNHELAEVQFWKQSNLLVHGKKIWDDLREQIPNFTCAKLFWWYNMYSSADFSVTPRPIYPADGRKFFDIYTSPTSIRPDIKKEIGEFPFPCFWGPAAGVKSPQGSADGASQWIAASARWIEEKFHPSLSLVYLPHLDYNLQRLGPSHPSTAKDLHEIDEIVGDLIVFFQTRSVQVILLSEYGITDADTPIHLNRIFRAQGWLTIKGELGLELLDCGASQVFAVADHQVAHIYLKDRTQERKVRDTIEKQTGIDQVLDKRAQDSLGINHPRSGDLIAVASERAWFTYYYWLDDERAPDFARCVDIHRKPGYDPVELFLDPAAKLIKMKIAWRLLQKKLGFRMLMDVIPLDASLVKGSHGRRPSDATFFPVIATDQPDRISKSEIDSTGVYGVIRRAVLD